MNSREIITPAYNSITGKHCLTDEQKITIDQLNLPKRINFRLAKKFDDKYVLTSGDIWKYRYSGNNISLVFDTFECEFQMKLCKYLIRRYCIEHSPSVLYTFLYSLKQLFIYLTDVGAIFNRKILIGILENGIYKQFKGGERSYFDYMFMIRELGSIDFPSIGEEVEDDLVLLKPPKCDYWAVYENFDNTITANRVSQIVKGIYLFSKQDKYLQEDLLLDNSLLSIAYVCGPRPSQFDAMIVADFKSDTFKEKNGISRYALKLPYSKQRRAVEETEKMDIALPEEVGVILEKYIQAYHLKPTDRLFPKWSSTSSAINRRIRNLIQRYCNDEEVYISLTQFRHNCAQSLAMRGAAAEDIAYILGHSTLVVARHYIMSTPELALVRLRALGMNTAWKSIINLMLTGDLIWSEEFEGRKPAGVINRTFHYNIGGCERDCDKCQFSEVRSCYTCLFFRPFIDGNHLTVLYSIQSELMKTIDISDSVGDMNNPAIIILSSMKEDVMKVMKRIQNQYGYEYKKLDQVDFKEV